MEFLIYLLKVSVCMAVFYGLYYFAFRQFTFHALNRYYLLCTLSISFIIPLIYFETARVVQVEPAIITETLPISSTPAFSPAYAPAYVNEAPAIIKPTYEKAAPDWRYYLLFTYIVVSILLSAFLLAKLVKIYKLSRKAVKIDNMRIVQSAGQVSNASFFKLIFLNTNGLTDNEKAQIIAHECVHIRQLHSIDILLVELCKIIVWFNPIIYFYKKSLIEVHEFEADLNTIQQFDSKYYAHLLLKLGINYSPDLTNQFSLHPLSTRIQFLFKKRTITIKKVFYFLGLPLLALGIFAFAQRHEKLIYEAKASASEKINNKIASLSEALKLIEKDAIGDKKELKSVTSSNQTDSVGGSVKSFINPFILKTPEIKLPDHYSKSFFGGEVSLIVRFRNTPEILSLDFFGDGKLLTDGTPAEDVHFFQEEKEIIQDKNFEPNYNVDKDLLQSQNTKIIYKEGKELIQGKDFEFIYEKGKISKVHFKEYLVSPYVGLTVKIKQTNPPKPVKKDSFFPLLRQSQTPELKSPWRFQARINTRQNFNTDTLRTFMPANFLGKDPLVIINGREYHPNVLHKINPKSFGWSYTIKPNETEVLKKYGEKGKDGVVEITTTDDFLFKSDKEHQVALENIQRELDALKRYKNDRIVKVRLLDIEGKEFERVIIKGFFEDSSISLDVPINGKIAYTIDGKIVSESEVINHEGLFHGSFRFVRETPDSNGNHARINLKTKR